MIAGTVGAADRMDFTVIGDTVNLAARLCGAASRGEIVADADTVAAAGDAEFDSPETISVKGRGGLLDVRRWRTVPADDLAAPIEAASASSRG